jgi:AcrR family transcriptional regulator
MDQDPGMASRKPRIDTLRNRERLLDAARVVFAEGGPGASLEAVARRAELGIGTLYRHFPTREALFQAVYRHEIDQLVALAGLLPAEAEPAEALRRWLHANIRVVATKRGMLAALAPSTDGAQQLFADSRTRLVAATDALMRRAQAAGGLRDDVAAEDVLRTLFGLCYAHDGPGWQAKATLLIDVFLDGLAAQR